MDGRTLRVRFWVAGVLAALSGVLGVLTLFWHEWIEALGFDPDQGSGAAEWLVVAALLLCSALCGGFARLEWRRAAPAAG